LGRTRLCGGEGQWQTSLRPRRRTEFEDGLSLVS
jgi:hypothetical protein